MKNALRQPCLRNGSLSSFPARYRYCTSEAHSVAVTPLARLQGHGTPHFNGVHFHVVIPFAAVVVSLP